MRSLMLHPGIENRALPMYRFAVLAIVTATLGTGSIYLLDDRWGMVLLCGVVGILWLLQFKYHVELMPILSFLFFTGAVGVGIFLKYNSIWLLTDMVILLIAWDLDRFTREIQPFSKDQERKNDVSALFRAHLKRLGIVALTGWSLGVVALRVQISLNFIGAMVLGLLALLSFLQIVRYFRQQVDQENT